MFPQKIAGLLAGFLFKIYSSTFRYEIQFENEADKTLFFENASTKDPNPGRNIIYACFHQDDMSCLPYFKDLNICILISRSKDGQILASATEYLGYQTVRGSSHRGAVAGLLAGMKKVAEGYKMTIAVDGPRGPVFKVKEGITAVANKFGRPIAPVRSYVEHKKVFENSWNKATLPFPFTKIILMIGEIKAYTTQDLEEKLLSLKPR